MTVTLGGLALYALALLALFLTPGPVWLALLARSLAGGFQAAWPLVLGVVVGDIMWAFLAILGVAWLVSVFAGFLTFLKWVASAVFLGMGLLILKNRGKTIASDSRLTRPGALAGFLAGLAVIIGNPKAILFYMGMLPGFFDLKTLTAPDIAAICFLSGVVPLTGNMVLGLSVDRVRRFLTSPRALRRTNTVAGCLLIAVAFVIPFT